MVYRGRQKRTPAHPEDLEIARVLGYCVAEVTAKMRG